MCSGFHPLASFLSLRWECSIQARPLHHTGAVDGVKGAQSWAGHTHACMLVELYYTARYLCLLVLIVRSSLCILKISIPKPLNNMSQAIRLYIWRQTSCYSYFSTDKAGNESVRIIKSCHIFGLILTVYIDTYAM